MLNVVRERKSISRAEEYDIGDLLIKGHTVWSVTDPIRFDIITKHFKPPSNYAFPKTHMNGCKRSFSTKWMQPDRHPWLAYSKSQDGVFCLPCVMFAKKENLAGFVRTPFNKWTKLSDACKQHEKKKTVTTLMLLLLHVVIASSVL